MGGRHGLNTFSLPGSAAVIGDPRVPSHLCFYHATSVYCVSGILESGLRPNRATRRGDFKASLGRTLWFSSSLGMALSWASWTDLRNVSPHLGPRPTHWMLAAIAVIWRPESSFRAEGTWVTSRVVHPQYIIIKCHPLGSCRHAFLWPKVKSVRLPPREDHSTSENDDEGEADTDTSEHE